MKRTNGDLVLCKESFLQRILLATFILICIWAAIGWFFGILVSSTGNGNAVGAIFLSWGIAFIIAMVVFLNSGE